jgi:hypothetical protein
LLSLKIICSPMLVNAKYMPDDAMALSACAYAHFHHTTHRMTMPAVPPGTITG